MVTTTLKSFSNQSKNVLKRFPSTSSAKKRFEAKLRRVRWRIYQKVQFRKKRLKRHLQYYEKQVQLFLNMFSTKLKPKETSIWTEKLAKTVRDVNTSLSGAKFAKKVPLATNVKTKPQVDGFFENIMHDYMVKVDSALFMISSILYLVRSGKVEEKSDAPVENAFDAPCEAAAAAVDAKEVAEVKEIFGDPVEDAFDTPSEIAATAVDIFEAHTEANSANATVKNSIENSAANIAVDLFEAPIDEKSAKKTATPVGQFNIWCCGLAATDCKCANTTVENFKALSDDKSAKKTSTRVDKDVNAYGIKFNIWCCGLPATDCKCDAVFPSGMSNSDPYHYVPTGSKPVRR